MAWKMDASAMCTFSFVEFMTGLARLNNATTEYCALLFAHAHRSKR